MFFRKSRLRLTHLKDESPRQKGRRLLLFVILLVMVGMAFWYNGERRFKGFIAKPEESAASRVTDATGTLSSAQLASLQAYIMRFEEHYGVRMVLAISNEALPDAAPPGVFYLGLSPARREVFLSAPPLFEKMLGDDLIKDLREKHFSPYFAVGTWPAGLAEALNRITDRLESGLKPQQETP